MNRSPRWSWLAAGLSVLVGLVVTSARAQVLPEASQVAPGVYVFAPLAPALRADGTLDEAVGNVGFIVGPSGTVVINSGASWREGAAYLAAAERVGGQPVRLLVVTQALPAFVLGAGPFAQRGIPVLAHPATAQLAFCT